MNHRRPRAVLRERLLHPRVAHSRQQMVDKAPPVTGINARGGLGRFRFQVHTLESCLNILFCSFISGTHRATNCITNGAGLDFTSSALHFLEFLFCDDYALISPPVSTNTSFSLSPGDALHYHV
jgi:hypothetical protein